MLNCYYGVVDLECVPLLLWPEEKDFQIIKVKDAREMDREKVKTEHLDMAETKGVNVPGMRGTTYDNSI